MKQKKRQRPVCYRKWFTIFDRFHYRQLIKHDKNKQKLHENRAELYFTGVIYIKKKLHLVLFRTGKKLFYAHLFWKCRKQTAESIFYTQNEKFLYNKITKKLLKNVKE